MLYYQVQISPTDRSPLPAWRQRHLSRGRSTEMITSSPVLQQELTTSLASRLSGELSLLKTFTSRRKSTAERSPPFPTSTTEPWTTVSSPKVRPKAERPSCLTSTPRRRLAWSGPTKKLASNVSTWLTLSPCWWTAMDCLPRRSCTSLRRSTATRPAGLSEWLTVSWKDSEECRYENCF